MTWSDLITSSNITNSYNLDLMKAKLKKEEPTHGIKTLLEDPYDLNGSMGYKERKYSLDFGILKTIPTKLSIVSAIVQTRVHQVSAFAFPFRMTKSLGFQIKHKRPDKITTKGEREMILDLERFISNCGYPQEPDADFKRDNFKRFLTKLVRDSLIIDQAVGEIVPTRAGTPYEFLAVDSSTIRLAAADFEFNNSAWNISPDLKKKANLVRKPAYVQLIDGRIENVYSADEMMFGVRNPRTDINAGGYGQSELEMLINIITSQINAETHNSKFFSNGSNAKGLLNFKGDTMGPDQIEGFKRMWRDQMEGVNNTWRTPILQSEAGIEWIDLSKANRDMEFSQWLEYLLKNVCSVYQIDPAEVGFDMQGGVSQTPLFESSSEWKLKASRDKGLRPLLTFFEEFINDNIVQKIDDDYIFQFVGLDELGVKEKNDLRKDEVTYLRTINELRREADLPDIEDGDVILNPTFLQAKTLKMQGEMAEQQQQNQPAPQEGQGNMQQGAQQQQQPGQEEETEDHVPVYSN